MARKIIGWLLFVWGVLGIVADIVVIGIYGAGDYPLAVAIRTLIALGMIIGGWALSHPKAQESLRPTSRPKRPQTP